jgi:M6 family metalloprotease-like protein
VLQALADSTVATFALLVVPVDFADWRLPATWEPGPALGPRLFPLTGETLANYFWVASRQRFSLSILLAPLVRLPGTRQDYSDIGFGGNLVRSRRMARDGIEGALAKGVDFRLLDNDGPDHRPGTVDDDGLVDGVLLLHPGPGDENDPQEGLIQALQYFIEPPVSSRGIAASSYAVASQQSGVGIWAHEVGHLLGLEDRYDVFLPVSGSDVAGRGGLGIFSLMAAGAFGVGAGRGAALLDAFSAAQLGWCDIRTRRGDGSRLDTLRTVLSAGEAWRVWTHGRQRAEYFLLEARADAAAAPFDAGLPAGQLVIYHVDEDLPERQQSSPNPPRHIRVALLEADGDGRLAAGLDLGRAEDLFPGALQVTQLTPFSHPSSAGYAGPTEVSLTAIASLADGVVMRVQDSQSSAAELDFAFSGESPLRLLMQARSIGVPFASLAANIVARSPAWGRFAGADSQVTVPLVASGDAVWTPAWPVFWEAEPALPPGASTRFEIHLTAGGWQSECLTRLWVWRELSDPLDFALNWPGTWQVLYPTGNAGTTWHRWQSAPFLTADGSPVLVCTGASHTSSAHWDAVSYTNNADAVLVSAPLPRQARALRIVHAIDSGLLREGVALDGGVVEFTLPDGTWRAASPSDGYGALVDQTARNALHGRGAFAGRDSMSTAGPWVWRVALIPIPELPAPVQLRLHFASDPLDRGRGWLVARLQVITTPPPAGGFPVALLPGDQDPPVWIAWDWPWEPAEAFSIQVSCDQAASWLPVWRGLPQQGAGNYAWAVPWQELDLASLWPVCARALLRVVAEVDLGAVTSRALAAYPCGAAATPVLLGRPYPNPSRSEVHVLMDLPSEPGARLGLFDVRGQRLRRWDLSGGRQLLVWDGRDEAGRRAAAGLYIFQLESGGRSLRQKVVLLH